MSTNEFIPKRGSISVLYMRGGSAWSTALFLSSLPGRNCWYTHRKLTSISTVLCAEPPRVLVQSVEFLLEVDKSKFLARAHSASTVESALLRVEESRVKEPKASHHCWGWRGKSSGRCSDDGEPAGTGGRPILSALESENVVETVVVVSRYYGGIKLGTGGLARAYGQSAREALRAAEMSVLIESARLSICFKTAQDMSRVYSLMAKFGASKEGVEEFSNDGTCKLTFSLPAASLDVARSAINEACGGRAIFTTFE